VRKSLSDAAEPMLRIPVLEQRLGNVEREVAHLQPVPASATEPEKLLAAVDAG
jgi:hypothetical protein